MKLGIFMYNSLLTSVHDLILFRWHIIKKNGSFSRSGGLQAGIDYVKVSIIDYNIHVHSTL